MEYLKKMTQKQLSFPVGKLVLLNLLQQVLLFTLRFEFIFFFGCDLFFVSGTQTVDRTKRMSIAVGPSSFASRKKKIKKAATLPNGS